VDKNIGINFATNIVQKNEFVFEDFPCELQFSILFDVAGPLYRF